MVLYIFICFEIKTLLIFYFHQGDRYRYQQQLTSQLKPLTIKREPILFSEMLSKQKLNQVHAGNVIDATKELINLISTGNQIMAVISVLQQNSIEVICWSDLLI